MTTLNDPTNVMWRMFCTVLLLVMQGGLGIGLAITKSLVDLHDGEMEITSKVGKGITVTVTLPNATP